MKFFTSAEQEMKKIKTVDQANYLYHLEFLKEKAFF